MMFLRPVFPVLLTLEYWSERRVDEEMTFLTQDKNVSILACICISPHISGASSAWYLPALQHAAALEAGAVTITPLEMMTQWNWLLC